MRLLNLTFVSLVLSSLSFAQTSAQLYLKCDGARSVALDENGTAEMTVKIDPYTFHSRVTTEVKLGSRHSISILATFSQGDHLSYLSTTGWEQVSWVLKLDQKTPQIEYGCYVTEHAY